MEGHVARYDARNRRATRQRDDNRLCGHRPDSRLATHRPSGQHHDPEALPALRTQTDLPGRRRHGYDRRSVGQIARAQPARRRNAAPQPGRNQEAAEPPGGFLFGSPECRGDGQQLRLDEKLYVPRIHPGHRQMHHRQLHDGERLRQEALQRRGRRHVVHRVHLPTRARHRLPAPLPAQKLQAANGRFGPVGQHHHRYGVDPAARPAAKRSA